MWDHCLDRIETHSMGLLLKHLCLGSRREGRLREIPQRMGRKFHRIPLHTPHTPNCDHHRQVAGVCWGAGGRARVSAAWLSSRGAHGYSCCGSGPPHSTSPERASFRLGSAHPDPTSGFSSRLTPPHCLQSPAPSRLPLVSKLSQIFTLDVRAGLCTARAFMVRHGQNSLSMMVGFKDRSLYVKPTTGSFLSCREESGYLGGVGIPQGSAPQADGREPSQQGGPWRRLSETTRAGSARSAPAAQPPSCRRGPRSRPFLARLWSSLHPNFLGLSLHPHPQAPVSFGLPLIPPPTPPCRPACDC